MHFLSVKIQTPCRMACKVIGADKFFFRFQIVPESCEHMLKSKIFGTIKVSTIFKSYLYRVSVAQLFRANSK